MSCGKPPRHTTKASTSFSAMARRRCRLRWTRRSSSVKSRGRGARSCAAGSTRWENSYPDEASRGATPPRRARGPPPLRCRRCRGRDVSCETRSRRRRRRSGARGLRENPKRPGGGSTWWRRGGESGRPTECGGSAFFYSERRPRRAREPFPRAGAPKPARTVMKWVVALGALPTKSN